MKIIKDNEEIIREYYDSKFTKYLEVYKTLKRVQ